MLDITEEKAKAIFKYIASTLRCSDVTLSNSYLMAKDIDTGVWFSVFLERDDETYYFVNGNNYISLLYKIFEFEYLIVSGMKYRIPRSLEELFIEMDLNR